MDNELLDPTDEIREFNQYTVRTLSPEYAQMSEDTRITTTPPTPAAIDRTFTEWCTTPQARKAMMGFAKLTNALTLREGQREADPTDALSADELSAMRNAIWMLMRFTGVD